MRNIKMCLAYDGTNYHGFQSQKGTGLKTVQEEIEKAVLKLTGEHRNIYGSGRTDAGVHAAGQTVNFFSNTKIPQERIPLAMNSVLPRDIVVLNAFDMPEDFHARYSAKEKTYCYTIYNERHLSPFWRLYSYHVPVMLDKDKMSAAAGRFIGEHNFKAFCAQNDNDKDYTRIIYDLIIEKDGPILSFTITGNGFLYNMVRIITGTLLEIGQGKKQPEDVSRILLSSQRKEAGATLPPQGLCLIRVTY